jgi:hypothetical protein
VLTVEDFSGTFTDDDAWRGEALSGGGDFDGASVGGCDICAPMGVVRHGISLVFI